MQRVRAWILPLKKDCRKHYEKEIRFRLQLFQMILIFFFLSGAFATCPEHAMCKDLSPTEFQDVSINSAEEGPDAEISFHKHRTPGSDFFLWGGEVSVKHVFAVAHGESTSFPDFPIRSSLFVTRPAFLRTLNAGRLGFQASAHS